MLILLFLFALVRHLHGAPIPGCNATDASIPDDPITNHLGTRQINDIVISCLATVFACTWTAIHPNIPSPCDSGWEIFKRQVTTMIYAVLAPEAITSWALRQHLAARRIARHYNQVIGKEYLLVESSGRGWFRRKHMLRQHGKREVVKWTITHGFFAQMGGFMLSKDRQPERVIYPAVLVLQGSISAPRITEAEIQDRSKGDALTKIIVVLQTTWFVAQCIVRWSSRLPVTELEVLTLGFAMLNGITYGLWWSKPQSVGMSVFLERKGITEKAGDVVANIRGDQETQNQGTEGRMAAPADDQNSVVEGKGMVNGRETPTPKQNEHTEARMVACVEESVPPAKKRFLTEKLEKDQGTGWQLMWRIPYRLVQAALRPLSGMMDFSVIYVKEGDLRVTMFYSGWVESEAVVYILSSIIASGFGLIHLIPAWFLHFPSRPEMLLWRVCAGITTVQPIILGIWSWRDGDDFWLPRGVKSTPFSYLCIFSLPIYIVARFALIVTALISLRKLDGGALVTFDWVLFIPHI